MKHAIQSIDRNLGWIFCLLTAAATAACTTTLSGSKAGATTDGLVYYLPAPHLYLSPQPDGNVTFEVKYLPDPTNAYTLKLNSYLTKATFEVGTINGLLTTVNLDADTTGVASAALTAATELRKSRITAEQTREAAYKTREEAKRAALKAAADAVTTQREKVELLEAKSKFYEENPPQEGSDVDLVTLKLEISQEKVRLIQLEARAGLVKETPNSAFNDPGASPASPQSIVYGPALFRMLLDGDGVKLAAVGDQITLAGLKSVAAALSVTATPARIVIRKADAQRDAVIDLSDPVKLSAGSVKIVNSALGATAPPVISHDKLVASLTPDARKLTITIPATLAPGRYRIDVDLIGPSDRRQQVSVPVDWLID